MARKPTDTDVYPRFSLYILPEKFYVEPRDEGVQLSTEFLEIDRHSNEIKLDDSSRSRIPIAGAEIQTIQGIVGVVQIVSGPALVVVKRAERVGELDGHTIWRVLETQTIPYRKTTLHLTEKQLWYNRHFTDMIQLVLDTGGFYFSTTFDLSRNFQWLGDNASPDFHRQGMLERADKRFVWNSYLMQPLAGVDGAQRFRLPLIHGFVGFFQSSIGGKSFQLAIISRRSILRAGMRFHKRGVNREGHPANFVETEQILQLGEGQHRVLTSFLQTRGSIPLFWSQKPNLRWQPLPQLRPDDDQLAAYTKHFYTQRELYGGKQVIVNLVNQKGREKRVGGELERVALQANLPFVRYNPFDFHKECHAMNWDRITVLRDQLRGEITEFGFFASRGSKVERGQQGYFRTNCMDCLDRTNVVQAMLAKESLKDQLMWLNILHNGQTVDDFPVLADNLKHIWADNGDECSKQYAGTGALKADFTRLGKRTYGGALNDAVNAITRYFRNNFADGYRQDAIDLFLGNFVVDPNNLPTNFETTVLSVDYHGVAIVSASFAVAMIILCVLVAENMTAVLFWLAVFVFCMIFIFLNGEEFVNHPKLKLD